MEKEDATPAFSAKDRETFVSPAEPLLEEVAPLDLKIQTFSVSAVTFLEMEVSLALKANVDSTPFFRMEKYLPETFAPKEGSLPVPSYPKVKPFSLPSALKLSLMLFAEAV
jgi:hypothetical protein